MRRVVASHVKLRVRRAPLRVTFASFSRRDALDSALDRGNAVRVSFKKAPTCVRNIRETHGIDFVVAPRARVNEWLTNRSLLLYALCRRGSARSRTWVVQKRIRAARLHGAASTSSGV